MGDAMVKKNKRSNKVKIGLYIAAVLVIAGVVFVGLFFVNKPKDEQVEKVNYKEVRAGIQEFINGREETEKFLDLKIKSAKLSEEEQKIVDKFEKVVPDDNKMQAVLQKVKDVNANKDRAIEEAVNKVALSYVNLHKLYLVEKDMSVMYDGELSDKDLEALSKSDHKYLVNMAKVINDYRGKVKKLSAKDKDFEKSYKSLLEEGESLNKKYATVKFEDIIGVKKEDVLAYYDRIDELNRTLLGQE